MSGAAGTVHSFRCGGCGGSISVEGLAAQVACPHCGVVQRIPQRELTAAWQYERRAGAILDRAQGERRQRAMWERWYGPDGKPRGSWLAVAILAPMIVVYLVGMGLAQAGVLPPGVVSTFLSVGIVGVYLLGMAAWVATSMRRRTAVAAQPAQIGARCPVCGAPQPFEVGRAFERCAYCGASLLAGHALMSHGLEVARADLRREAMARFRLERSAMAAVYRQSMSNAMPYVVLGSFLPMIACSAVAFTVDYVSNDKSDTPLGGLLLLWLLALVNGGLLAGVYLFRRVRRTRWRSLASEMAGRLQGRVITGRPDWVAWLNALWAGPYDITRLQLGPCWHAIAGRVGAFPVALDLDPVPADGRHSRPRAEVMLAACLPPDAQAIAPPPDLVSPARALGFQLSACPGGFLATYDGPVARLVKVGGEQAVRTVTDVARLLVEWATRLGTPPAAPIP